jgi:hypothetical protein
MSDDGWGNDEPVSTYNGSKTAGRSGGGGDNACFKCGETGHMSRECPKGERMS